jgi:hypothetical protein
MRSDKARRTAIVLKLWDQLRVVVPYSDFKLYQDARKYNLNYREYMLRAGKRFMKRSRKPRF